jgi:hypothetical protein
MTLRQATIHRHLDRTSGAKQKTFAPRIEFERGLLDWCIVITPTAATTSGVRIEQAAQAACPKLKNSRALAPFHTAPIAPWRKTGEFCNRKSTFICSAKPGGPAIVLQSEIEH